MSSGSRLYPALFLTVENPANRDTVFHDFGEALKILPKIKISKESPDPNSNVKVFEKGTVFSRVALDVLSIGAGAGGETPNLNMHYYLVLEKMGENQIVLAFHGNDSLRTKSLQQNVEPVLQGLHQRHTFSAEWGTSLRLPKSMTSSPAGFRKHLGLAKWFFWT